MDGTWLFILSAFRHSFGYDSGRRANLQLLDDTTLIFIAGNILVLIDTETKEQRYLRSCSGGGIGSLTVRWLINLTRRLYASLKLQNHLKLIVQVSVLLQFGMCHLYCQKLTVEMTEKEEIGPLWTFKMQHIESKSSSCFGSIWDCRIQDCIVEPLDEEWSWHTTNAKYSQFPMQFSDIRQYIWSHMHSFQWMVLDREACMLCYM